MRQDRIPDILSYHDPMSYFRQHHGGLITEEGNHQLRLHCPYHNDGTPSAIVDHRFHCFGCGKDGDVIDVYMWDHNCDRPTAINALWEAMGGRTLPPVQRKARTEAIHRRSRKPKTPPPTPEEVYQWAQNTGLTLPYFKSRGLLEPTVKQAVLGSNPKYYHGYRLGDKKMHSFANRFVFPYLRVDRAMGESVIAATFRQDPRAIRDAWLAMDDALIQELRAQEAKKRGVHPDDISDERLIDIVFGGRYMNRGGLLIYNEQRVLRFVHGKPEYLRLPYVFLFEGEVDALTVEQAGFSAIAAKPSKQRDYAKALQNVKHVYVVADNDKGRVDELGRVANPGGDIATRMARQLKDGGASCTIITPPSRYKDANEVHLDGELENWLSAYNVTPRQEVKARASRRVTLLTTNKA